MRFGGPRMLLYHPIKALRHLYYEKRRNIYETVLLLLDFFRQG